MEKLARIISDFYGVDYYKLFTRSRKGEYVKVRALTMYIARMHFKKTSYSDIAGFFDRDHATALHAIKSVKNDLETNVKFRSEYKQIRWIATRAGFTSLKPKSNKYCNRASFEIKISNTALCSQTLELTQNKAL